MADKPFALSSGSGLYPSPALVTQSVSGVQQAQQNPPPNWTIFTYMLDLMKKKFHRHHLAFNTTSIGASQWPKTSIQPPLQQQPAQPLPTVSTHGQSPCQPQYQSRSQPQAQAQSQTQSQSQCGLQIALGGASPGSQPNGNMGTGQTMQSNPIYQAYQAYQTFQATKSTKMSPKLIAKYMELLKSVPSDTPNAVALVWYLMGLCREHKRLSTVRGLKSVLQEFLALTGEPPSRLDLASYIKMLSEKSTASQANRKYFIVRRFLRDALNGKPADLPAVQFEDTPAPSELLLPNPNLKVANVRLAIDKAAEDTSYPVHLPPLLGLLYLYGLPVRVLLALTWGSLKRSPSCGYVLEYAQEGRTQRLDLHPGLADVLVRLRKSHHRPQDCIFDISTRVLRSQLQRLSDQLGISLIKPEEPVSVSVPVSPSSSTSGLVSIQHGGETESAVQSSSLVKMEELNDT